MTYRSGLAVLWGLVFSAVSAPALGATLTAAADADFDVTTVGTGINDPTDVAVLPDGRVLITQRAGKITVVRTDETQTEHLITVNATHQEQGLLGIVVDPDFTTNHYIYLYASIGTDALNRHQVLRYTVEINDDLTNQKAIVDMGLRGPANLNGGGLDFYNGALYISVGDTGQNATPPTNKFGTCLNVSAGKLLRVNPSTGAALASNPLMNETMVTACDTATGAFYTGVPDKRIFDWGLRNPFRFWVDPKTGRPWIGDVGEAAKEEISIGAAAGGQHFGWPFFEGTTAYNQSFKPANDCLGIVPAASCVAPAHTYNTAGGASVIGGRILDGCQWPAAWTSRYIFGDFIQNKVWTREVNANRDGLLAGSPQDFATVSGVASIKLGLDNSLYLVEYTGDKVSKVTATAPGTPTDLGCERIPNGEPCGGPQDVCESGYCVDDVCCDVECGAKCMGCKQDDTGVADGTCAPILAGEDFHNDCAPDAAYPQSCEEDGVCDGDGACRAYAVAGTDCGDPQGQTSCEDGQVSGQICDGAGMCSPNGTADCAPYACDTDHCGSSCADDTACTAGVAYCLEGGTCADKKDNGQLCSEARECASDFCVDGVCCDSACEGQCSSCSEPDTTGACVAVEGTPRGGRDACDGDPALCGGACDGKEPVRCTYDSTTVCASSCADATEVLNTCNGKGACVATPPSTCGNYQCGENACLTSCSSAAECGEGFDCNSSHKCVPSPSQCISETESRNSGDEVTSCEPYLCDPSTGGCLKNCVSSLDCSAGYICNAQLSKCQTGSANEEDAGCGCRSVGASSEGKPTWAVLLLAGLFGLRRRRSSRVRAA